MSDDFSLTLESKSRIAIRRLFANHVLNQRNGVTKVSNNTPDQMYEEIAVVEVTLEQMLSVRYEATVNEAIEEALDEQPYFYRPFQKKTDKQLEDILAECQAACVTAKLTNEKPDLKIDCKRRDAEREQKIRNGTIPPEEVQTWTRTWRTWNLPTQKKE